MAKCSSFMPMRGGKIELLTSIGKHTDKTCMRACEEGGKVMERYVRDELENVIGKDLMPDPQHGNKIRRRSSGTLLKDLGVSPPQIDKNGNYNVKVGFYSYRDDGKANALVANVLEYGTSKRKPKPFLAPAKRKGRNACQRAMGRVFEEALNDLTK